MTISQLSIFLENRSGTLITVLDTFKRSGIQIVAATIADTAEYGILRIICSDPKKAYKVLEEADIAVALSEVFAIELDNRPGEAADAFRIFSDSDISITYMYSFVYKDKGILVFRTDNSGAAREAILRRGLKSFTQDELAAW